MEDFVQADISLSHSFLLLLSVQKLSINLFAHLCMYEPVIYPFIYAANSALVVELVSKIKISTKIVYLLLRGGRYFKSILCRNK